MALTPQDVHDKEFHTAFRGYNEEEVDSFLDDVEAELGRLTGTIETLRQQLELAQATAAASTTSEVDEVVRSTLLIAQRTADATLEEARREAARVTADARREVGTLLEQARTRAAEMVTAAQERAAQDVATLERRHADLEAQVARLQRFERDYRSRLLATIEEALNELRAAPPSAPTPAREPHDPAAGTAPEQAVDDPLVPRLAP